MKAMIAIGVSFLLFGCDQSLTIHTKDGIFLIKQSSIASAELNGNEVHIKYLDGSVQRVTPFQLIKNPAWTNDWKLRWKRCMRNASKKSLTKDRIQAREACAPPDQYIQNPMYAQRVVTQLY